MLKTNGGVRVVVFTTPVLCSLSLTTVFLTPPTITVTLLIEKRNEDSQESNLELSGVNNAEDWKSVAQWLLDSVPAYL